MKSPGEAAGPYFRNRPTFLINRSFGLFWVGQSISTLGSQVTAFAIPLLAALTLHATAQQMGFLRAAEFAPFLVLTLPAGVWADLGIRRFLMIFSNLIRGVLIIFVPLAVFLGLVRLEVLYVVMFAMGSFKVIFEMAYQTYIPEIVDRETLVNATYQNGGLKILAKLHDIERQQYKGCGNKPCVDSVYNQLGEAQ